MDGTQLHRMITNELHATYKAKNADYGDSFTRSMNDYGLVAGTVRIGDKFNRLSTLTKSGMDGEVKDESIRDTLLDLANYAIMTAMWLDNGHSVEKRVVDNGAD